MNIIHAHDGGCPAQRIGRFSSVGGNASEALDTLLQACFIRLAPERVIGKPCRAGCFPVFQSPEAGFSFPGQPLASGLQKPESGTPTAFFCRTLRFTHRLRRQYRFNCYRGNERPGGAARSPLQTFGGELLNDSVRCRGADGKFIASYPALPNAVITHKKGPPSGRPCSGHLILRDVYMASRYSGQATDCAS